MQALRQGARETCFTHLTHSSTHSRALTEPTNTSKRGRRGLAHNLAHRPVTPWPPPNTHRQCASRVGVEVRPSSGQPLSSRLARIWRPNASYGRT